MILLIAFAFLAGIVTVLSPCILPILPIILSSSVGDQKNSRARPLGIVTGFVISFTFFTLFLSTIVSFSGISADSLRLMSVVVIFGFGLSLLIPRFQVLLEQLFSKMAAFMPKTKTGGGFGTGIIVGISLGLLWTPCVGPILASVISLAITGQVTLSAFFITIAYSLGTAIPMFLIMWGGQNALQKVPWLLRNTARIQKAFGIIMILTSIGIATNIDRKFQTFVLEAFPQYGVGLTKFEENSAVKNALQKINGQEVQQEDMGKPLFNLLPKGKVAPEIVSKGEWFNTESFPQKALTLADLRGKVVIVDFWTYSCINCIRTFPYLKKWHDTYKDQGLVIVGVHSPEFEFEKSADNVKQALKDFEIEYPVVQDNDFATWRAYSNHYWPAKYIIDKDGYIRYTHFGEGKYDETEEVIQQLLREKGEQVTNTIDNMETENFARTPETYVGLDRLTFFDSAETPVLGQKKTYSLKEGRPQKNYFGFSGEWTFDHEFSTPEKGAVLRSNFEAKEVFLVMRPIDGVARVKVLVNGEMAQLGDDVVDGIVTVDSDKLYRLVKLNSGTSGVLDLEFLDGNVEVFAFTFG